MTLLIAWAVARLAARAGTALLVLVSEAWACTRGAATQKPKSAISPTQLSDERESGRASGDRMGETTPKCISLVIDFRMIFLISGYLEYSHKAGLRPSWFVPRGASPLGGIGWGRNLF
jgi:hypothetical protein